MHCKDFIVFLRHKYSNDNLMILLLILYFIHSFSFPLRCPIRHSLLLVRGSPGRLFHSALMPSMSSSDEARRRLRTLSLEQLRGNVPRGKACMGSSRSVRRERRLVEGWAAGDGGSMSCSIRASVSDCIQLSLDGIRNSFRGTSSLFGCQGRAIRHKLLWILRKWRPCVSL